MMENKGRVEAVYKALLGKGQMGRVAKVLGRELEWWFHGPPECQHMMRMLTGETAHGGEAGGFRFEPRSATAIGECVITEGWEGKEYWVHVWTLKNGMITQLREYFNTWLVVRDLRLRPPPAVWEGEEEEEEKRKIEKRMTLWQSQPRDLYRRSLPGLVLAI